METVVYALYYVPPDAQQHGRRYFYVGQSVDVKRRMRQHELATATGHEDKYAFMRTLAERGLKWDVEEVGPIPPGQCPQSTERWHVIRLVRLGHELQNMRHGSKEAQKELAAQAQDLTIRSIADVRADSERRRAQAGRTSRLLRRKIIEASLKNRGVPDVPADTILPRVLRRRLIKEGFSSIERGIPLADIYSQVRATPMLLELLNRVSN